MRPVAPVQSLLVRRLEHLADRAHHQLRVLDLEVMSATRGDHLPTPARTVSPRPPGSSSYPLQAPAGPGRIPTSPP